MFPFPACAKDRPGRQQPRGRVGAMSGQAGGSRNPPSLDKQSKDQNNWEMMPFSNPAVALRPGLSLEERTGGPSWLRERQERSWAQCGEQCAGRAPRLGRTQQCSIYISEVLPISSE